MLLSLFRFPFYWRETTAAVVTSPAPQFPFTLPIGRRAFARSLPSEGNERTKITAIVWNVSWGPAADFNSEHERATDRPTTHTLPSDSTTLLDPIALSPTSLFLYYKTKKKIATCFNVIVFIPTTNAQNFYSFIIIFSKNKLNILSSLLKTERNLISQLFHMPPSIVANRHLCFVLSTIHIVISSFLERTQHRTPSSIVYPKKWMTIHKTSALIITPDSNFVLRLILSPRFQIFDQFRSNSKT